MRREEGMNEKLRSSPRHSENFETRSLPPLTHCFPRNFTFYVSHPIRSIREQGWLQRSVDDRRSPLPAFVRLSRRLPPTFDFGVTRRRVKQQAMTAHPPWRAGSALA